MKIVDMHCDTIPKMYRMRAKGEEVSLFRNNLHVDLEKMKAGGYCLQNFAMFVWMEIAKDRPFEHAMTLLDIFYTEIEAHPELIGVVRSYEDIEKNRREGRMSALISIEEGAACQGNLQFLRDFYRMGVRMMSLTWNFVNELATPNIIQVRGSHKLAEPDTERGLTETGIAFVEEMDRLGMIIDVSHLNDGGFRDVVRYGKRPFVASHSNCRALVPGCLRNLTDEMLRALAERGGVAGVNYCTGFLRSDSDWKEGEPHRSLVSDVVRHMKHMKQVGGIGCIGLGSDFDGFEGDLEMRNASELPLLEAELHRQGFTSSEIDKVLGENVLRVYKDVLR